ncbi:hypothetical protein [Bremerella alba]|uniref:Uncharacterized protein n=1 Tax=Bremerella alba TaxID=980252 RepID=A0A7V9A8V6_9BACT|nr:hypothetical protein [Bremerella alba]MBA2116693.1 hypothetical protein [Bremerella alba]
MNVFDSSTWNTLDDHPVFQALNDPDWRENYQEVGDSPDLALRVVRNATERIRTLFPLVTTELVVLDSLDWFVEIESQEIDGQIGHCDDQTVYLRLHMNDKDPLYEDKVPLELVTSRIMEHFDLK